MIKFQKSLAGVLAGAMVVSSMAGCGNTAENPAPEQTTGQETTGTEEPGNETEVPVLDLSDTRLAAEAFEVDVEGWSDASSEYYDKVLGDFYDYYQQAQEASSISERYALMAVAEAKLMESAVMFPTESRGGNYSISRVAPYSGSTQLWGNDEDRQHYFIVATEPIAPADRDEMKAKWAELRGTGEYTQWAKDFLTEKGYTLKDEYIYAYTSDPTNWDCLGTSRQADTRPIVQTYDSLYEYDNENNLQPALATDYSVSADGLTYTFTIREGVTWVDSQGRKVADVKADDFVAGMQHMMDAMGGLEYLVGSDGCNIKNADAYINGETTDFSEVGVKAVDDYTLEYTLEAPCSFFMTMLSYSVFAPMSRDFYTSKGGKFGEDFDAEAETYLYGKTQDDIAYCGPFLVKNWTKENTIVFVENPTYWNREANNVHKLTWLFNDGTDPAKTYNNAISGVTDAVGLTNEMVEMAKSDGNFDKYVYVALTDATSFMGFLNVNRSNFANAADNTVAVSTQTMADAARTHLAMQNVHFRRAILTGIDRGTYEAQVVGEDLKYNAMRNCYTPGTFVSLPEDVTIDIAGTSLSFSAGTYYGEIMQAAIDADGEFKITVWDPKANGGVGSSDGYDGWYDKAYAASELETAISELAAQGLEISTDAPIVLDLPYFAGNPSYTNRANALKKSLEDSLGGKVVVNLVACETSQDWYNSGYYTDYGYEMNCDIYDVSGWGPDYGDPQTYLATFLPDYSGYMVKCTGMF